MTLPKITVVTPSYNQGQFLEETILSVLSQGYPNLEYIVIDGGSTDNSVDIIKKYQDRLTYWVSEKDKGQTNAINKGLSRGTGQIMSWLNSDDVFMPDALNKAAEYFIEKPFDFLLGNSVFIDAEGKELSKLPKSSLKDKSDFIPFHPECIVMQPSSFFSKQAFEKAGPLDETLHFAMDVDFWMKIRANRLTFRLVDDYFTRFRRHGETKSSKGNIPFIEDTLQSDFFNRVLPSKDPDYYRLIKSYGIRTYLQALSMEHFTAPLLKTSLKYLFEQPVFVIGNLCKYFKTKFNLFLKARL